MTLQTEQERMRQASRHGLTLVEVVVSMSLFAFWIVGAVNVSVRIRQLTSQAQIHYTATNIAKSRIELGRTYDAAGLLTLNENSMRVDDDGNYASSGRFQRTTTVTTRPDGLLEMTVRVDIRDPHTRLFAGDKESANSVLADFRELPR